MAQKPTNSGAVGVELSNNNDFYVTDQGKWRVGNIQVQRFVQVCRICLVTGTKMYNIRNHSLEQIYSDVCGIQMEADKQEDKLPQELCWECAARLLAGARFRARANKAHQLLTRLLRASPHITLCDINSLNRRALDLETKLTYHYTSSDECHILVKEAVVKDVKEDVMIKEDIEDEIDIPEEKEILEELSEVELATENSETNDYLLYEYDNNDSTDEQDDDIVIEDDSETNTSKKRKIYDKDADDSNEDDFKNEMQLKKVKLNNNEKAPEVKAPKEKKRAPKEKKKPEGDLKDEANEKLIALKNYKMKVTKRQKQDDLDETMFTIVSVSAEEQVAEIQQRRHGTKYKRAPYKCRVCYMGFSARWRYDAHCARHSEEAGAFECVICGKRQRSKKALRSHLFSTHTRRYKCNRCPFVTKTRYTALLHQSWHGGSKFKCPHCPREFTQRSTYLGHVRIKHRSDVACGLCGYTFLNKMGLHVHINKHHRLTDHEKPREGPNCETCDVRFASRDAYGRHLKFSSRHGDTNDSIKMQNDPLKNLASSSKGSNRSGNVPVTCEQCNAVFKSFCSYSQHFRRYHPDKIRTQFSGNQKSVICDQCGRIFQSNTLLKDHMLSHSGVKTFQCDKCDKTFDQKFNLLQHIYRTNHDGERNFQCNECSKSFSQKSTLATHIKTHFEKKSYPCFMCDKVFAYSNNLKRHVKTHNGVKQHRCVLCDKGFFWSSDLKSHFKHVHLKEPWPKRQRRKAPVED